MVTARDLGRELAQSLIDHGIPVVVCRPNPAWAPGSDAPELFTPKGWNTVTAADCDLSTFRPGVDALAMVGGHGVDAVDVDTKDGGSVEHLPAFRRFGRHRTPSGGHHDVVVSTGVGKLSPLVVNGRHVGDYVGGTSGGGGRLLAYLPGSTRPKYPGLSYVVEEPLDLDALLDSEPDDDLVNALIGAGGTFAGEAGKPAASPAEVVAFMAAHAVVHGEPCHYGRAALAGLLDESRSLVPGDPKRGRHGWTVRAVNRVTELTRAGCCSTVDLDTIEDRLREIKPEGGTSFGSVLAWAIKNADGPTGCGLHKDEQEVASYDDQDDQADAEDWPEPEPLASAPAPVDVAALPAFLRDIVTATASSAQTPVEVPLVFALGVLSAATRGCWDVRVTSSWDAGPTALYGVTLADSGERKSGGARPLLAPLGASERELVRTVNAENRARRVRREAAEARLRQAVKDDDQDGADKQAAIAHENRHRPVPALVLSDTTTEALGVHLEEQGGATALFNTEATAFSTVAGHYSDKGGNVGLLNHAYDAERFADKRIKRSGVTIPRPFLAWAAAVQTTVLTGYANGTTEGSGFLARFVLLLPTSMVGGRNMRTVAIPDAVQAAWDDAVTELHARAWQHYAAMADDPEDYGDPLTITLSADAADALLDYAQRLEDAKAGDWSLRDLGGWIEKHPARVARIAALFALAENPYALTVEARHLDAALSMAPALVAHAKATMRVLRNTGSTGLVRRVLDVLVEMGKPVVSTRDVHYKVRGQSWAETADAVRDVLQDLEMLGYVRPVDQSGKRGPGRRSELWRVHSSVLFVQGVQGDRGGLETFPHAQNFTPQPPHPPEQKAQKHRGPEPAPTTFADLFAQAELCPRCHWRLDSYGHEAACGQTTHPPRTEEMT